MHWKTTLSGILAAIGTALQAAQLLPPPFNVIPVILTAIGQLLLGWKAADRDRVSPRPAPRL
jgi:hypothetical protein